ncbi:MAG: S-layer homology domain-containing protein [Clostridia bacterium]|nr:S-layer homology domain-containing protein [Clostridia bacterium]
MKRLRKVLAIILVLNMIFGTIPDLWKSVYAAPDPLNIYVDSYSNGTLTIRWDSVPSAITTTLTYHTPRDGGGADLYVTALNPVNATTTTITGLKSNYIYDIKINIDDGNNGREGKLLFMPQVTFNTEIVDQHPIVDPTGGSETGVMPALKMSWAMPKVYDSGINDYRYVHNSFNSIASNVTKLGFTINIADSSPRSDIKVSYLGLDGSNNPLYKANVAGDSDVTRVSDVKYDSARGMLYFYLLGRKADNAYLATRLEVLSNSYSNGPDLGKAVLPEAISSAGENTYVLPHGDILPGTVFTMKINSQFTDAADAFVDVVRFGQIGTGYMGALPYTYTPVRFQLTKDSMDNVYVKIFKINKGSLDLPRLYYELQTNSIPSSQDDTWLLRKTLDDTYFSGAYAYTVISGINVNNTLYYRIVVKTDGGGDRIESLKMPYTLSQDTSRPPVPKNLIITKRELATRVGFQEKSTDVTISWDKPANWDQIKGNLGNDIYFHFLLSTAQIDMNLDPAPALEANGKIYGNYPVKYRLVKYVSANSPNIDDSGTTLKYTLKGFDLFKWEDELGNYSNNLIPNAEGYPSFLLPNKVYYMQVFATKAADKGIYDPERASDKSIVVSFTTLTGNDREVPLPNNFRLDKNDIDTIDPKTNYIQVQFDKINVNWANYTSNHSNSDAIYYDIYMSTRPVASSFVRVASTQNLDRDVVFEGVTDAETTYIRAKIKRFTQGTNAYVDPVTGISKDPYDTFGATLLPNATYYIMVKTRLVIQNPPNPPNSTIVKESIPTAILSVTTIRGSIGGSDDSAKRPLAPTDFAIATDANGNPMLTGQTVTFNWTKQETGVRYSIICTTQRVAPNADPATYINDPIYQSFNRAFGNKDNNIDGNNYKLTLDPGANPLANNFQYDNLSKIAKYTIDTWLFPNKLYYFSIKAEVSGRESVWVSIPVTTSYIEAPTLLSPVNGYELGFYWNDITPDMKAEDYKVYLKGPKDSIYKLMTRSQATVAKDGSMYYGRIYGLKPDTAYSIRVFKGANNNTLVYDKTGLYTRDSYHQVEVKWSGYPVDANTKYEIAIKTADAADYTILSDVDFEQYTDVSGRLYPYYYEKTSMTVGTSYNIYYARIKTIAVTLPDGTIDRQRLKSNMKYQIKVRALKIDTADAALVTYSKYAGPVDTRTEFNQEDYDKEEQDLKKEATFLDRITKLEEKLFWRMDMSSGTTSKILLKGDRVVNAIKNSGSYPLTLDISALAQTNDTDIIYMPVSVAKALNTQGKNLVIKTLGAEFTFKPKTIDVDNVIQINSIKTKTGVKDVYLKVTAARATYPEAVIPSGTKRLSKINDLKVQVLGSSKTDTQVKEQIREKLYDSEVGIVKKKTDILMNPYQGGKADTPEKLDSYISGLVKEVEAELSVYINDTVEGTKTTQGMIIAKDSIKAFNSPMAVKLSYSGGQGLKVPYINYEGSTTWQKLTNNVTTTINTLGFNVTGTGKYIVAIQGVPTADLTDGHWAKGSINKLTSKYDLKDVFAGIDKSFNPELTVTVKEVILLYEKVMGKTAQNAGLDIKQKAKKLQLDSIINLNSLMKDVTKQEMSVVLGKLYSVKMGISLDNYKPSKRIKIVDEATIGTKYYNSVVMLVDLKVMTVNEKGNFAPNAPVSRAQLVDAVVKLLELTGDM